MKRSLTAAIVLFALAANGGNALAWGPKGHYIVNHLAVTSLPTTLPSFMRSTDGVYEIAHLGIELDRQKGAGKAWDGANDPGHYVDLGDDNTIFGLSLSALPPTQEAYDTALRSRGYDQYKAGYLPYSMVEGWQQLRMDFAYWRVDAYESAHAMTGIIRAKATLRRNLDEALVLRDVGVWGHFVADASQPLHISVHFNGWGKYPNPHGFTNSAHVHDLFETEAVDRDITEAQVAKVLAPLAVPTDTRLVSEAETMNAVAAYLLGSNATVTELYSIDKAGGFAHGSSKARTFLAQRLAYGAGELRNLTVWAWQDSINQTIGDDFPQRVGDIVDGSATYKGTY